MNDKTKTEDDLDPLNMDEDLEEQIAKLPQGRYAVSLDGDVMKLEDPPQREGPLVENAAAQPSPGYEMLESHPILGAMITEPALLEFSAQYDDLIDALAAAQADFDDIPKNRTGKVSGQNAAGNRYEYEYKYADISDVLKEVRPKLAKRGIVITQQPVINNQRLTIVTMLLKGHQWMRNELVMPMQNAGRANPNQVLGGQITYLRRYPLCAMVGVQAEEDLDSQETGSNATGNVAHRVDTKQAPGGAKDTTTELDGCINAEQQQQIKDALSITGISINKVAQHIADEIGEEVRPNPQSIPADHFDTAMRFINAQADEGNA